MMLGMSQRGILLPVIDEDNASFFAKQVSDPAQPFSGGFDAKSVQFGLSASYSRSLIPRKEWDDHINRQEAEQSSPDHWRLAGGVPILDQNGYSYCWEYGTVGATMTGYAQMGDAAPHLSAMCPAYQGKRGRNVGGYAGEALEYIRKYGLPELSVWPEHDPSVDPNSEAVKRSAAMHNEVEDEELPSNSFDHLASALLDPERPTPVTIGLAWWGHLIYATRLVKTANGYGVKIANSWKKTWGLDGCAVLAESKSIAFEQRAIVRVKPRVAVAA